MWRFVVRYHANENGYFVLAINGAEATYPVDQTFWRILSGTQPINLGKMLLIIIILNVLEWMVIIIFSTV